MIITSTVTTSCVWTNGAPADNESYDPLWRQWGVSLSGEWGRRFEYDHHWYLEPNTQWVIGYLQGKSWSNDKVQVQTKGTPSLVGRVGFNLGKVSADERKRLYGKFNVYHDFLAKNKMTFTNESMTVDKTVSQRGTWVKVGLGGALTLGKETQLYADVDTTIAGKFSHDLSVNVGLKWKF